MNYVIKDYKPENFFRYFEDICAIPHGSGNEAGIADYIESFAKEHSLWCYRDEHNNLLIRKPATPGYEGKEGVLLQGHTDMVCEKDSDTVHNFETDPLKLQIRDGFLSAEGTTLGGDDGVAVAAMLAVLDSDIPHPELECLFTTSEEVGLCGAFSFDYSQIKSKRLINLDSETEGIAVASCAGGVGIEYTIECDRLPLPGICRPLHIKLRGLAGGHSGEDIIYERGNSLRIMGRLLDRLYDIQPFNLVTVSGGNRDNAIPRESEAVILTTEPEKVTAEIAEFEKNIRTELSDADRAFRIHVCKAKGEYDKMFSFADTSRLISVLLLIPNGVISRIPSNPEMVETSNNIGILRHEGDTLTVICRGRSSLDSKTDMLKSTVKRIGRLVGGKVKFDGCFSGWAYNPVSKLQKDYITAAKQVMGEGREPKIAAIHAGLECGIIISQVGELDAISIGPDIYSIHSPGEKLDLRSCERFWEIIVKLLAV